MVAVGELAPDFESVDQDGAPFRLSSLRGAPVILYFYPKADTPGCTSESKGFRDHYAEFRGRKVQVVGVSVDDCPEQKAFQKKYGLPFPLVADAKKEVAKKYGVLAPQGYARRVSFFLDGDGRVLEVVDAASPDPHLERARARFL
jgi:thioredoxin-dependent peroxiredoxin